VDEEHHRRAGLFLPRYLFSGSRGVIQNFVLVL
jgi:hypothetical protein